MMTGTGKKTGLAAAALALALIVFPANCGGAEKLPRPYGYVNDFAGVMEEETMEDLNGTLEDLADRTGAQVVVIILSSIRNETAEQLSKRAMREWSAEGEPLTHVILLVIGLEGRKVWIEAGAGLEGVVPWPERKRIISAIVAPLLRRGDLDQGVRAGVREIELLLLKKYNILPGSSVVKKGKTDSRREVPGGGFPVSPKIIILLILIPTAAIIVLIIGKKIFIQFFSARRHGMNGGPGGDEFGGGFGGFGGGMKGV